MGEDHKQTYQQQKLVPGEFLFDDQRLKRLYDADDINSQYVHSIFLQEYEKNLIEAVYQKRITNGEVPDMMEKPKHDAIKKQTDELLHVFYHGDRLTDLEYDIERMYISEKLSKY